MLTKSLTDEMLLYFLERVGPTDSEFEAVPISFSPRLYVFNILFSKFSLTMILLLILI